MPRLLASIAALVLGILSWGGVAFAQSSPQPSPSPSSEPRDLIVLSGDVTVHRGEDVGEVIVLHGAVDVAGVVHGDVVVLDGRISVTGQVSGSVIAIDGRVQVGSNAQILGDVMARDRIHVAKGASIGGSVREGTAFTFRTPIDLFGPFATWLAVAVSTLALAALLLLVAPRASEAVVGAAIASPLLASGIGLAAFIAIPALSVAAALSLVGLPLGLAMLLGLLLLYSVGFSWSVFALGRAIWHAPRSRWLALVIGWAIVAALSAIPYVGGVLWLAGSVVGLGSMTVATWRARGPRGRHRPGGKMQPERVLEIPEVVPEPMITEGAMGEEGTGI